MLPAHVILCERTSQWAVAWRRALRGKLRVIETRTLADCERELATNATSIVGVETSPERAAEIGLNLSRWRERHPDCLLLALGGQSLTGWDPYLREAGALGVLLSRREVPLIARQALRHARRFPRVLPAWKQVIWGKLPWSSPTFSS